MGEKIKLVAVAGPTGSGKSRLAVLLAEALHGQVISCDSMQIYRNMDIGTGKITREEMHGVRHRMLDIADPSKNFSLAEFTCRAAKEIEETVKEGFLPIVCGGTGLYLENLLCDTALSEAPKSESLRAQLEEKTSEELYECLLAVDRESAEATHPNNRKRVIRALEIYELTGKPKSEWDRLSRKEQPRYDAAVLLLLPDSREALYESINRRADGMFASGLENEVRALFSRPVSDTASQAIGYKEFLPYFEGRESLEEVKEKIKQASRNYAKRQLTWFINRQKDCPRISSALTCEEQLETALEILRRRGIV